MWWILYLALLAALFVRVQTDPNATVTPQRPLPGEPLGLVMRHHRIFYTLLLAVPLDAAVFGGRQDWRWLGALLFATGVALYRIGGEQLGESRTPFVLPKAGARLVSKGLYRYIRHPMYLGHALIAIGAPLTLGVRWSAWLTIPALVIVFVRVSREEAALVERVPGYAQYVSTTKRLIPFIF